MISATTGPVIKIVFNPETTASTLVLVPVKRKKKRVRKSKKPKSIYGRVVEP